MFSVPVLVSDEEQLGQGVNLPKTMTYEISCHYGYCAIGGFQAGFHGAGLCYYAYMESFFSDHIRVDERSLAMHRRIAEKVRADPALLDVARDNVQRARGKEGSPLLALSEWEAILGGSAEEVAEFLEDRSDRARRLRQSSPFAGILTEEERNAIYESYSTRTYYSRRQSDLG